MKEGEICYVEAFEAVKRAQKLMFKDQSTCTGWGALKESKVNDVLENKKKELSEEYKKDLEKEKVNLLSRHQELLRMNAEMKVEVDEQKKRNAELKAVLQ